MTREKKKKDIHVKKVYKKKMSVYFYLNIIITKINLISIENS